MTKRGFLWLAMGAAALSIAVPALAERKLPNFMSLKSNKALMRAGPGRNYPGSWLYRRRELPVRVLASYGEWRKVEDPDGTQGWMLASLLDEKRTAIVMGAIAEMRSAPKLDAGVNWRAAPGVVGRISHCSAGWCWFDVKGRGGYIEQSHIWGTEPGESFN